MSKRRAYRAHYEGHELRVLVNESDEVMLLVWKDGDAQAIVLEEIPHED